MRQKNVVRIVAKIGSNESQHSWVEKFDVTLTGGETPVQKLTTLIKNENDNRRPSDIYKTIVSVVSAETVTVEVPVPHVWRFLKERVVVGRTQQIHVCRNCGVIGKRFPASIGVFVDPKYKKYESCPERLVVKEKIDKLADILECLKEGYYILDSNSHKSAFLIKPNFYIRAKTLSPAMFEEIKGLLQIIDKPPFEDAEGSGDWYVANHETFIS